MGSPRAPQGGAASGWGSGSAVQEGQGQLRGWGEAEKGYRQEGGGEAGAVRRRGTGGVAQPAGAKAHRSSGSGQEGWGSSLCAKPLCRAVRCSACRSETPGPCLCRTALRPCPASSALARPQRLSSEPQSSRGCPPAAGRTDGREARGGQSLAGGLPSGLPEQQDPSVSLAGLTGRVGAPFSGPSFPFCSLLSSQATSPPPQKVPSL